MSKRNDGVVTCDYCFGTAPGVLIVSTRRQDSGKRVDLCAACADAGFVICLACGKIHAADQDCEGQRVRRRRSTRD